MERCGENFRFAYGEPRSSYALFLSVLLNLETLRRRRVRFDLYFLYKLLTGNTECPDSFGRLSFSTPITAELKIFFV